jgi:DMSO/TMAO reductase YedYZ molybdopterin-dependent catalytic subunit
MRRWLPALAALIGMAGVFAQELSMVSQRLALAGEVQRELSLSVEELKAIGARRGMTEVRGYSGVRLADLLEEADIRRDAPRALRRTYVVAVASDGYQALFSWGELFNTAVGKGVLVAIERDGLPLRDGEGRFALVSPADERPGPRHVKWLARIEVRRIPEAGR